jgi:hypothetical protein
MKSKFMKKLKIKFVQWLLRDVEIEKIKIGDHTITISTNTIDLPNAGIITSSAGTYTIKKLIGLQIPVGTDKYVS